MCLQYVKRKNPFFSYANPQAGGIFWDYLCKTEIIIWELLSPPPHPSTRVFEDGLSCPNQPVRLVLQRHAPSGECHRNRPVAPPGSSSRGGGSGKLQPPGEERQARRDSHHRGRVQVMAAGGAGELQTPDSSSRRGLNPPGWATTTRQRQHHQPRVDACTTLIDLLPPSMR